MAELLRGNLFPSCSLMPMLLSYSCFPGTSRYSRDLKQSCTDQKEQLARSWKGFGRVWTRSWQVGTALTTGTAQALSSARVEVNNQLSGSTSAESCVKQLFFICFCALSQTLEKGCMVVRLSRCLQENESKARWRICEVPWELQLDCKQRLPSVCLQMLHASLCSTRLVAPRIIQTSMKKHR